MPCLKKKSKGDPKEAQWSEKLEVNMPWSHSYPHSICWLQLPVFIYLNGLIKIQETKPWAHNMSGISTEPLHKNRTIQGLQFKGRGGAGNPWDRKGNDKKHFSVGLDSRWKGIKMIYTGAHMNVRSCRIRPVLYNYWMLRYII